MIIIRRAAPLLLLLFSLNAPAAPAGRDAEQARLEELLPLDVVPTVEKERWAAEFIRAYGENDPYSKRLSAYLAPPSEEELERRFALRAEQTETPAAMKLAARARVWAKLTALLALETVSPQEKERAASAFLRTFGADPADNPHAAELAAYVPAGMVVSRPKTSAAPPPGKPRIERVKTPDGSSAPFTVSAPPRAPRVRPPAPMGSLWKTAGLWTLDIPALKRYDETAAFDKSDAGVGAKAKKWRELAISAPRYAEKAGERAAQWERYASELISAGVSALERAAARDADWKRLAPLLSGNAASASDKAGWAEAFAEAYGATAADNSYFPLVAPYRVRGRELEWVTIPGGSFLLGSDENPNEKPRHRVTVKSFQIAKTEVTNEQYRKCVDAGRCTKGDFEPLGDDYPVTGVDWAQAKNFAEWAGGRLPSEAEWEYAARGGGLDRGYPWGDDEATCATAVIDGCGGQAAPVCSKPAGNSVQGLCDMAGNVWEWTQDWYHNSYEVAPSDGSAWEDRGTLRVRRGGGADRPTAQARSGFRGTRLPEYHGALVGFRPAR